MSQLSSNKGNEVTCLFYEGCSKSLSSKAAASEGPEAYPQGYVEDLNDARTTLAGFFNIRYSAMMLEPGDFILNI